MWAKTSRFRIGGLVGVLLLAGCGGSSKSQSSSTNDPPSSSSYPAQYKEDYFADNHCGTAEGDSTSSCECQVKFIEAHLPYKDLEEGSSEHAKAEGVLNEAPSHCEAHTASEEAAHDNAVKAQEGESKAYSEQEQKDKPEEEHLHEIEEHVRYEHGE
jgi:hypothetical protein